MLYHERGTVGRNLADMDIHVRCQGDDNEYVKISSTSLPENPYDVIYLLKVEFASRSCWRDVACAYFEQGKWSAGITVLEQATSDDVESALKGSVEDTDSANKCTRIDLLAALGGAHLMVADMQLDNIPARNETLRKAANVFSRADKIDLDHPSIWAARGWADFLAGKLSSAREWFDNARDKGRVLGLIGLAAIYLNFRTRAPDAARSDAVTLLTGALRAKQCPPGVWTGLGYALFREGRFQDARDVTRRAIRAVRKSAPSERLEALYLLALIETADPVATSIESLSLALREAYVECGGHSDARILTLIAELHFKGGDFESAAKFAGKAVSKARDMPSASVGGMYAGIQKSTLVQALFQQARAHHHLLNTEEAIKGFDKIKSMVEGQDGSSLKVNPAFYLRLGLLKLATGRKEDEGVAVDCLEKVQKNSGERSFLAMRALGFLLGRRALLALRREGVARGKPRGGDSYQRALNLLKTGLAEEGGKNDVPALLVYAGLVEESSPEVALDAYEKVVKFLKEADRGIDPEICVNMSSCMSRLGRHEEARKIIKSNIDKQFARGCSTVAYNRGRLAEMCGEQEEAVAHFREIADGKPHFVESQLRLGVIAKERGNVTEAERLFKLAMADSSSKAVAVAYLSDLYASQKRFQEAQDVLEHARNECDYLTLSFARFMHRFLDSLGTQERRDRFLINHIGTPVLHVLRRSKHNAFAANAAGVYFAENKAFDEARDAFTAAGASPLAARTARVNLAHTLVHQGRHIRKSAADATGRLNPRTLANAKALFEQAEKLYRDALRANDVELGAQAMPAYVELQHYKGCTQLEAEDPRSAVQSFQKVLHFAPMSNATWYNLGLALYDTALTRIRGGKSSLREILRAKAELEASRNAFQRSLNLERKQIDPVTHSKYDPKLAEHWYRYIRQETKRHEVTVVNAKNDAEDREQRRREKQAKLDEAMRKEREKAQQAMEAESRRQKELELAAKAAAEKLVKAEEAERRERERVKRENELVNGDEDDEYGNGSRGAERPVSRHKKRKRTAEPDSDDGKRRRSSKNSKKGRARNARDDGDSSDEYPDDVNAINGFTDDDANASEAPIVGDGGGMDLGEENGVKQPKARRRFAIESDSEGSDDGVKDEGIKDEGAKEEGVKEEVAVVGQ